MNDAPQPKPIVVLKPGLFDESAKQEFRDAGYYVVEHKDPQSVVIVLPIPTSIGGSGLLNIAMRCIHNSPNASADFGKHLSSYLEFETRNHAPQGAPKAP